MGFTDGNDDRSLENKVTNLGWEGEAGPGNVFLVLQVRYMLRALTIKAFWWMTQQNSIDNENAYGKSAVANETQGIWVMGTEAFT